MLRNGNEDGLSAAFLMPGGVFAALPASQRGGSAAAETFALVQGVHPRAAARIAWEVLRRRRRVLVCLKDLPGRLGPVRRLLLSSADGVLASPEILRALTCQGFEADEAVAPAGDLSPYLSCPCRRDAAEAHRMIYVGELSPHSGVVDFLYNVSAWAERYPEARLEICWVGDGDLRGVLRAQLLPPNVAQTFVQIPAAAELAAMFAKSGLLVIPSIAQARSPFVAEAMTAGLPVLGSIRSLDARALVIEGKTGWLFDPLQPGQAGAALDAALTATPGELDWMRTAARVRGLQPMCSTLRALPRPPRILSAEHQSAASGERWMRGRSRRKLATGAIAGQI